MDKLLYIWQLPQNIIGKIIIKITKAKKNNEGYYTTKHFFNSAISLGDYIIFQENCISENSLKHEQGHQKQSKCFGWFYLFIIGLPSIARNIWDRLYHKKWTNSERSKWYYNSFPEKQADILGGVERY